MFRCLSLTHTDRRTHANVIDDNAVHFFFFFVMMVGWLLCLFSRHLLLACRSSLFYAYFLEKEMVLDSM